MTVVHDIQRIDPGFVVAVAPGVDHIDLLVPDMSCAGCMSRIERRLHEVPGVAHARVNLTGRRVAAEYDPALASPDAIVAAVEGLGYQARPVDVAGLDADAGRAAGSELVRAMAVAGFAAGNVMLLSVSVWSGAETATRDLFHWISAAIAIPAVAYAGQPFFRSAARALARSTLNMDVPIAVAVILACAVSLYETATGGPHAYFDASVALLFFLLVGRYLDHRMRAVARSAAARLSALGARSAALIGPDGSVSHVPAGAVGPGDRVQVAAGERLPVDGTVVEGASDIDRSMLTGEPEPERVVAGGAVFAGTINLTGPLVIAATRRSGDTLLAEIARLMEAAERARGPAVRLADRAARVYAPVVHLVALATFAGWLAAGAGWHTALTTAVAVLIITCPCALGLAVPAVQVVASGVLFRRGILVKDGAALERLAAVDTVVFDKTGTLTQGRPRLVDSGDATAEDWAAALALARASRHPLARALGEAAEEEGHRPAPVIDIEEHAGSGMEGRLAGRTVRLGRAEWAGAGGEGGERPEIWLRLGARRPVRFRFEDALLGDAVKAVARLKRAGLEVVLMSGDREAAVARIAGLAGIGSWRSRCLPADKAALVGRMREEGRRVVMVGDGINDAPALASADVSMSPASGADIAHAAADIVFTGAQLEPVAATLGVARAARRTIRQNIALAVGYNAIAVPLAVAGLVTPLIAAIAMSGSSVLVTLNAVTLRLRTRGGRG